MKKILAIILTLALLLSFTGCQQKSEFDKAMDFVDDATKDARENRENREKMIEENMVDISDALLSLPTGELNIKSYSIVPASFDETKKDIVFVADFTNNSNNVRFFEYGSSMIRSNLTGYQNGVKLASDITTTEHFSDGNIEIKPGTTIEIMSAMVLEDDSSDIELEFYYLDNNNDPMDPATYTLSIK